MTRHSALVFAGILAIIISLAPACVADDTANLPVWKPDPKIVAGLGPDFVLDSAAIRVPSTFIPYKSTVDNQYDYRERRGPKGANGIGAVLIFAARPLDTFSDSDKSDKKRLASLLARAGANLISDDIDDATMSSLQSGLVGSQQFSRQYFKGYNHRWLTTAHGFFYGAVTDQYVYVLGTYDEEPYSKYSLPVIEAAFMTFHISDQPNTPFPAGVQGQNSAPDQSNQ